MCNNKLLFTLRNSPLRNVCSEWIMFLSSPFGKFRFLNAPPRIHKNTWYERLWEDPVCWSQSFNRTRFLLSLLKQNPISFAKVLVTTAQPASPPQKLLLALFLKEDDIPSVKLITMVFNQKYTHFVNMNVHIQHVHVLSLSSRRQSYVNTTFADT